MKLNAFVTLITVALVTHGSRPVATQDPDETSRYELERIWRKHVYYGEESELDYATGCPKESQKSMETLVDNLLRQTKPKIPEPVHLPFRDGIVQRYNGTINNLSTMRVDGEPLICCTNSSFVSVIPVRFDNGTVRYLWKMRAVLKTHEGYVNFFTDNLEVNAVCTRKRDFNRRNGVVEIIEIRKIEGLRLELESSKAGVSDPPSNLKFLIDRYFKEAMAKALQRQIRILLNIKLLLILRYQKYWFYRVINM